VDVSLVHAREGSCISPINVHCLLPRGMDFWKLQRSRARHDRDEASRGEDKEWEISSKHGNWAEQLFLIPNCTLLMNLLL
jgi:hypothetical protein